MFIELPLDIHANILFLLNNTDIVQFAQTCRKATKICQKEHSWFLKCQRDFSFVKWPWSIHGKYLPIYIKTIQLIKEDLVDLVTFCVEKKINLMGIAEYDISLAKRICIYYILKTNNYSEYLIMKRITSKHDRNSSNKIHEYGMDKLERYDYFIACIRNEYMFSTRNLDKKYDKIRKIQCELEEMYPIFKQSTLSGKLEKRKHYVVENVKTLVPKLDAKLDALSKKIEYHSHLYDINSHTETFPTHKSRLQTEKLFPQYYDDTVISIFNYHCEIENFISYCDRALTIANTYHERCKIQEHLWGYEKY